MVKAHNKYIWKAKKVLIVGSGGACAAVKAVCEHENAKVIVIAFKKRKIVVPLAMMKYIHLTIDADIIVNTSPVGMFPNIVNAPVDVTWFHKLECVLDVVYNPILTRLCFEAGRKPISSV